MQMISQGSKGSEVMLLQRLLNKRGASPKLDEDADFGPKTKEGLKNFQAANGIVPVTGVCDGMTWAKFGRIVEHFHRAQLYGQPTGVTCWSAAATMMTGNNASFGPGSASLLGGGLEPSLNNVETFARGMGWRVFTNMSAPPPSQLIGALQRSPIWVVYQGQNFAHAVIFNAVYSDGDESGDGTVFSVYDPWPVGRGTIYSSPYTDRQIVVRSSASKPRAMIASAAS